YFSFTNNGCSPRCGGGGTSHERTGLRKIFPTFAGFFPFTRRFCSARAPRLAKNVLDHTQRRAWRGSAHQAKSRDFCGRSRTCSRRARRRRAGPNQVQVENVAAIAASRGFG